VFHLADEMSITYDNVRDKDEEEVYRMFVSVKYFPHFYDF